MRLCTFFMGLLLACRVSAQGDVTTSLWFNTPPVVDGNNSEWQKPFYLYDGSTGIMFAIANDNTNLYLCFTVNEEWKARKMLRAGWEVEVSCKEKNKKANGVVKVPGFKPDDTPQQARQYGWGVQSDFGAFVNPYRLQFSTIEAQRFLNGNGTLPYNTPGGIQVNLQPDSLQGMVIEVAIPLGQLIDKNTLALTEQLQVQVTVNGLSVPTSNNTPSPNPSSGWDNGANRGSNLGGQVANAGYNDPTGRPDMDEGQNSTSYPPSARSPLTEQASFKQKVKLVTGK